MLCITSTARVGGAAEQNGGPRPQQGTNLPEALAGNPHEHLHTHAQARAGDALLIILLFTALSPPPDPSCVEAQMTQQRG